MPGAPPAATGRWRRLLRDDRGSSAVEFALGAPIVLSVVLLLLQMFAWGAGSLAAHAAADHAAQTTRVVGGSAAAGHADAAALLADLGGSFIDDPSVSVSRSAAVTTVTVRGHTRGLPFPISVTVHAPTERYVP
ncbi:TadE/TadG family type IV pilus assembly protein [Actinoplanes aureus]|uniref:Pilus assembly protein n=1 Tax=Actinoplanes aureus TaxID=2792083 RepID=A0A931CJV6_9ACTN|nr:TadE/TadG family type IV pilus assembly protein [Actinoplanes aureus]MBG0569002.1 pilus assembly protein [Actinoplanes aureus]